MLRPDAIKDFRDNLKDVFVEKYKDLYYYNNQKNVGKKEPKEELGASIYCTQEEVEQVAIDVLSGNEIITWKIIAWKAGRLKYDEEGRFKESNELPYVSDDGKYAWDGKNGRGYTIGGKKEEKPMNKKERVEDFLKDVIKYSGIDFSKDNPETEKGFKFKDFSIDEFKRAYECILELQKNSGNKKEYSINYMGAVYNITLIYFLSKGEFPIYDKFAHKAAKAIYLNANPEHIFVGEAPGKDEKTKVYNMYFEYCWLLKQIFGTRKIDIYNSEKNKFERDKDQALWVYGHSKKKFPVSDDGNNEPPYYSV